MEYFEFNFSINPCNDSTREILAAELSELGFDGFIETDSGFIACIETEYYNADALNFMLDLLKQNNIHTDYFKNTVIQQNWNAEWEKDFQPVIIDDICLIKAPFHNDTPALKYEIIIQPYMTFGTGHHETTYMMISEMLNIDFKQQTVLDIGCGTGILAIFASILGAKNIIAIDNDPRACENTSKNIEFNKLNNIKVLAGTSELLTNEKFKIILTNISKNSILNDAEKYCKVLTENGEILCSGFYLDDLTDIEKTFYSYNFELVNTKTRNNWIMVHFRKKI